MANVNSPFGFIPTRHMSGNSPRSNKYTILSGLAENIFSGDIVMLYTDGTIQPSNGASEADKTIGVFGGCSYTASDGSYVYNEYWPTGTVATDIIAYVYDDPNIVFRAQSAGTPAQTNIGNCADVTPGSGSTVTGNSASVISGTMADTLALTKIIALWDAPENSFGQYAILEVLLNEHLLAHNTAGI
jgi:hypothetical protein|tara:strand:+ start:131 stop:691 length:561 start_codon:yes stop_codon:yes gene_type:complete